MKNNHFVNEIIENIWNDRYSKDGEDYVSVLNRVSKVCGCTEEETKAFYDVMSSGLFFPAGRTMSNAGIGRDLTLNNCFTSPKVADSLEEIFNKVKLGATTHQKGGKQFCRRAQ